MIQVRRHFAFLRAGTLILVSLSFSSLKSQTEQFYPASDSTNSGHWILNEEISDEFEDSILDSSKWWVEGTNGIYKRWAGRAPSQFSAENVSIENGKLHLSTKWDTGFNFIPEIDPKYGVPYEKYTTAAVIGNNTFLFGYMEIKCKAADASITSSFWTTGGKSELDMFEFIGDSKIHDNDKRYRFCTHDWSTGDAEANKWCDAVQLDWRVADDIHVYGCEWDEDYLKFYADGELVKTATKSELGTTWVLTEPLRIWVDSETFYWEGFPNEEDLPVDYEIEYIRVWQNYGYKIPKYNVSFRVIDSLTEIPLANCGITIAGETYPTDSSGECTVGIDSGSFSYTASHDYYSTISGAGILNNDTTIKISLVKQKIDVQFRVLFNGSTATNAIVSVDNKMKPTDSAGTAVFKMLHMNTTYPYNVNLSGFFTFDSSFNTSSDTTIIVNFNSNTAISSSENLTFFAYPNPASDFINIYSDYGGIIHIINSNGLLISSGTIKKGTNTMDISDFSDGIYILRVMQKQNTTQHRILTVQ